MSDGSRESPGADQSRWDGHEWVSADGRLRWDGVAWVPAEPAEDESFSSFTGPRNPPKSSMPLRTRLAGLVHWTDVAARGKPTRWIVGSTQLAVGLLAAVFGIHDAVTTGALLQLFGLLVAVLGVVAVAGKLAPVVVHQPADTDSEWRAAVRQLLPIVPVAAAVATGLILVSLLVLQVVLFMRDDHDFQTFDVQAWSPRIAVSLGILLVALVGVYAQWKDANRAFTSRWAPRLPIIATAGLLFGAGQTWYTTQFIPTQIGPSLTVTAAISRGGTAGGMTAVTATISVHNTSDSRITAIASMYRFSGIHLARHNVPSLPADLPTMEAVATDDSYPLLPASAFEQQASTETIQVGRILTEWIFEPGEQYTTTLVAEVPASANYDLIRLNTDIYAAKGDLGLQQIHDFAAQPPSPDYGVQLIRREQLAEPSWLLRMARPERNLAVIWQLSGGKTIQSYSYPQLIVGVEGPTIINLDPSTYGIAVTSGQWEMSTW